MGFMTSDRAQLREDLSVLIDSKELTLSTLQKGYLRSRWLVQMLKMDSKHQRATRSYYALRLLTVVGSIFLLMLVSLYISGQGSSWGSTIRNLTIFFTLLVSVCVMVEHLFDFGERFRRYERIAERLKAEGWRFLQLSGSYQSYNKHSEAFSVFANQVEALNQMGVEVYNFDVIHERKVDSNYEVESPKKFDSSPRESVELIEAPMMIPSGVRRHSNPQRTQ